MDEEAPTDYGKGGYLRVALGDRLGPQSRYEIQRKLGCVTFGLTGRRSSRVHVDAHTLQMAEICPLMTPTLIALLSANAPRLTNGHGLGPNRLLVCQL
jgi:hypothetical protein